MEDTPRRREKLAAITLLAMGLVGCCAAPNPNANTQPTLLGFLGLATPAQVLEDQAKSDNAPIAEAAKIKKQACLKCKKIKAIKYLAKIGCGCYDKDGAVSKALIAAMGDCDEEVRLAAVKAIIKTAKGGCCENCGSVSCCKKDVVEQLAKMAYEVDDKGCWIEPSERVRNLAAQAAEICCPFQWPQYEMVPTQSTPIQQDNQNDRELKKEPTTLEPAPDAPAVPVEPGAGDQAARRKMLRDRAIAVVYTQFETPANDEIPGLPEDAQVAAGASREKADDDEAPGRAFIANYEDPVVLYRNLAVPVASGRWSTGGVREPASQMRRPEAASRRSTREGVRGVVRYVDPFHGVAHVEFGGTARVAPGTRVVVEHQALFGKLATAGLLEVVSSEPGSATVKALGNYQISRVASGDQVYVSRENS
jgi:hypothetical protein